MDFPIGKGSAPRRLFVDQTQPFPSCPKITPKDDINPLSDFRFDQTITLLSETAPDSPANNCAQPLSSWPAQVTITPLPPYNVNPQPPTNPAKILLPTPITPNVVSITPKETFDANPSALFGSQPLTIDCRAFSPSPVATRADPAPNSQGNIIQPLCYGPVSEGHYFLLQPVCYYLNKDGNTKIEEEKRPPIAQTTEKAEVKNQEEDKNVKPKKNPKKKKGQSRKGPKKQTGRHNSSGIDHSTSDYDEESSLEE